MSSKPAINDQMREKIIAQPDVILEDQDLMRALIAANERALGGNIVDLRGIAMERLEARAILRMLDPTDFETFLRDLGGEVADILRVDSVRLVLESVQDDDDPAVRKLGDVLSVAEPGFIEDYLTAGRPGQPRQVTLRQLSEGDTRIYGARAQFIRSEACLMLDFGKGRLPGMLAMGAEDPHQFSPQQGTDLLAFFTGVFERAMRRWLS